MNRHRACLHPTDGNGQRVLLAAVRFAEKPAHAVADAYSFLSDCTPVIVTAIPTGKTQCLMSPGLFSSSSGTSLELGTGERSLVANKTEVFPPSDLASLTINQWPEFTLDEFIVYQGWPSFLVSLLNADTCDSVTVCGRVWEVPGGQQLLGVCAPGFSPGIYGDRNSPRRR